MRQMERVPKVSVNHIISGEVSIQGTAEKSKTLFVPDTPKTPLFISSLSKRRERKRIRKVIQDG